MTVVSRLRKDAALWTVPGPRPPHRAGPNRVYGEQRIDLAKRGGPAPGVGDRDVHPVREADGEAVQDVRGDVAAGRGCDPGGPGGRAERVGRVLLHRPGRRGGRHPRRTVADRFSPGDAFRGREGGRRGGSAAGPIGVRASVGAFHICLWTFTMTEAWAWGRAVRTDLVGTPDVRPRGTTGTAAEPRGQAAGVAAGIAGWMRYGRLLRPGPDRAGNPSRRGTPAQPRLPDREEVAERAVLMTSRL